MQWLWHNKGDASAQGKAALAWLSLCNNKGIYKKPLAGNRHMHLLYTQLAWHVWSPTEPFFENSYVFFINDY
jgi:hypothetical protein